jgi:4-hydroxy-tetrahydrodipicolinate reductase
VYARVAEALGSGQVDVLLGYSCAWAVKQSVWAGVEAGVHVVVGSSGLTAADYEELDRLARDRGVGVVAAGNFSVMAAVLRRAATLAAQHLSHWEIKPDVPSGTSSELADALAAVPRPARPTAARARWSGRSARNRRRRHPDPIGPAARLRRDHGDPLAEAGERQRSP